MYSIIFQNNASKQEYVVNGLRDTGTPLAYVFENFQMPEGAQPGEYSGYLFFNGRTDVEYELRDVVLDSILHTTVGDVLLRDLKPEIFLMRYGEVTPDAVYKTKDVEYYYRKK